MKKRGYILSRLALPLLAGAALRIWQLPQQIVLQDEWHAVSAAVKQSFGHIATHFQIADNCIPLSLFFKSLLETAGLTEFGLRLLPMVFGILGIVLLPLSVRRLLPDRDYLIFAFLLALSPLLIYYSRFARPYIITAVLSFLAVLFLYRWRREEKTKYLALYLLTGIPATWFNLPVFPVVAAPLVYFFFTSFKDKPAVPSLKKMRLAGLLFAAGFGLWFFPTLPSLQNVTGKMQAGAITWTTIEVSLHLFTGSGEFLFVVMFLILFVTGMTELAAKQPEFFGLLLTIFFFHILSIILIKPLMIEAPIVLSRYSIGLFPFWLLAVSAGVGRLGRLLQRKAEPPRGCRREKIVRG